MIKTATQLKAKVRNLSGGDSQKAQTLIRNTPIMILDDSLSAVDAETDTLIYPGENGILYLIKLNTSYDPQAGTLSIAPDNVVKWRYNGTRSNASTYWWLRLRRIYVYSRQWRQPDVPEPQYPGAGMGAGCPGRYQ